MKRTDYGTAKVVAYVTGEHAPIYLLSCESAQYWEDLKNDNDIYIAIAFEKNIF